MTGYKDAGVDIERGDETVERLKKHVEKTFDRTVLRGIGSFAGAIDASALQRMKDPVLLFSIDGVGTKTEIAATMNRWEGIGHDIVNHSANDLVCQGGKPLVFLDYIASSRLDPENIETIVKGASEACRELQCALIGGETAEMPQVYREGSHDVVGAICGVVERSQMITGENIAEGDILIAFPSNGLHTNGYSLARKVLIHDTKRDVNETPSGLRTTLGEALLKPHTLYANLVLKLHKDIGLKGVAHITGSGIPGNLPRILPHGLGASIEKSAIRILPIFHLIQQAGDIPNEEMFHTFNMGVGMIIVVEEKKRKDVLNAAEGSYVIGTVCRGEGVQFDK